MKIIFMLYNIFLCCIPVLSFSQISESASLNNVKKDTLHLSMSGITCNQGINSSNPLKEKNNTYNYVKPVIIGTEISGSFYNFDYPILRSYGVSLAFYPGSSNTSDKRIRGLGELSKQYQLYFDKPSEYNHLDNNLYYAPGISIFSKNKKYSLDLFQSFSSDIFQYGNQNKSHYKLNFRF